MSAARRPRIAGVSLATVPVSPKTRWILLRVHDDEGRAGHGEATLQRREALVQAQVDRMAQACLGQAADPSAPRPWSALAGDALDRAAAVSAFDHALWDLAAHRAGVSLARLLGAEGDGDPAVPLYANVNRGLTARTPQAFAEAAAQACRAGFEVVKIAPFDEVDVHGRWGQPRAADASNVAPGLARVAAVRAAVGARALRVDCHWRFDPASAAGLMDRVAPLQLDWLECPVPEDAASLPAIRTLRDRANRLGMRLAGGEDGVGLRAFEPFLQAGAYDVLMPDIKYVGGLGEMQAVARAAAAAGVALSPHNPSGPVAHAVSTHACAALPALDRLELQFAESLLFETVLDGLPPADAGRQRLRARPGRGVEPARPAGGRRAVAHVGHRDHRSVSGHRAGPGSTRGRAAHPGHAGAEAERAQPTGRKSSHPSTSARRCTTQDASAGVRPDSGPDSPAWMRPSTSCSCTPSCHSRVRARSVRALARSSQSSWRSAISWRLAVGLARPSGTKSAMKEGGMTICESSDMGLPRVRGRASLRRRAARVVEGPGRAARRRAEAP